MTKIPRIDLVKRALGALRIGDMVSAAISAETAHASAIEVGSFYAVEVAEGLFVIVEAVISSGESWECRVVTIEVDDGYFPKLGERDIRQVSATDILSSLERQGISNVNGRFGNTRLSNAVDLSIHGDQIEGVSLGNAPSFGQIRKLSAIDDAALATKLRLLIES